jgi:serine/threonine protein phosphatase PrpC
MPIALKVCAETDIGRVRPNNEDAFVVADLTGGALLETGAGTRGGRQLAEFEIGLRGVLLAVSDGLGGNQAGEIASALVVESLSRSLASGGVTRDPDVLLERATQLANREVWEAAHHAGREGMGATLTALYIRGHDAHIAEVGDSRAYLVRAGAIRQVTRDQSYVQLLVDAGAMTPEAAQATSQRHLILQAMGLEPNVNVALGRLELRRGDLFVLCSDGLSTKMSADEMRDTLLQSARLDVACARLVDLSNARGGDDNITVIAASVSGDLPRAKARESISDTYRVIQEFEAEAGAWLPAERARL